MYQWMKSCAELTVRVDVQGTSPNRPKSYMMETHYGRIIYSYPFYNQRELKNKRYGSGALSLTKYIEGFEYDSITDSVLVQPKPICNTCPCEKCQHSDNPSRTWWRIYVLTGAHVVFDDVEASNTTCRLFYDEPSSPLVTLGKMETHFFNIVRDECQLCYVTCEPIGDTLFQLIEKRFRLWLIVKNKFQKPKEETFNFIVSHPHGCSKQITFGHWIQKSMFVMEDSEATDDMEYTAFNYTTATCPGSSGARVYTIARGINLHCGAIKNGANFSGIGPYEK
ncbi:uncharacterized protein LOC106066487 [Biomphalaria glabrata]|uniref:Uncharacterized protein LOC106066487 n=1 Tax=Biomphalaria glabrata TaxID=6526 RepID=A0A9W2YYG6_BIOGL|nr:uncharacterized protein LOC106066487 [Biomphalaria glabrata]